MNVKSDYEVIIAGGGPSGCAAAAAAARKGAKTLLIEATYTLGGMGTSGLVTCFAPFGDGEKQIYCGIAKEVSRKSNRAALRSGGSVHGVDVAQLRQILREDGAYFL